MRLINSLREIGLKQEDFPIFYWDKWLELERNNDLKVYLCYDEELEIVVPFKVRLVKFLRKGDYLYVPLSQRGGDLTKDEETFFVNKFHEFLRKSKVCDVVYPPSHIVNFKCIPKKALYYSLNIISINLELSVQEIFDRMNYNYRKKIRQAIKSNVLTSFDDGYIEDVYALYRATHERQDLSYEPIKVFNNFNNFLAGNVNFGISSINGINESGILNIFDHKNAYGLYGGTSDKPILSGSNKLLIFESAKVFKDMGIKSFVLGGYRDSRLTDEKHNGIQEFKLRFGSDISEGYHFIKIINPIRYNLFTLALKIKSIITRKELGFVNESGLEIKKSK